MTNGNLQVEQIQQGKGHSRNQSVDTVELHFSGLIGEIAAKRYYNVVGAIFCPYHCKVIQESVCLFNLNICFTVRQFTHVQGWDSIYFVRVVSGEWRVIPPQEHQIQNDVRANRG